MVSVMFEVTVGGVALASDVVVFLFRGSVVVSLVIFFIICEFIMVSVGSVVVVRGVVVVSGPIIPVGVGRVCFAVVFAPARIGRCLDGRIHSFGVCFFCGCGRFMFVGAGSC